MQGGRDEQMKGLRYNKIKKGNKGIKRDKKGRCYDIKRYGNNQIKR